MIYRKKINKIKITENTIFSKYTQNIYKYWSPKTSPKTKKWKTSKISLSPWLPKYLEKF